MQQVDPGKVGMNAARLERIAPTMDGYVERGQLAGVSTLVARHGEVVHSHQCGHSQ